MKVVALVPMRHDSERVPGKNRRLLGGVPLFHYILRTLVAARSVERIVVDSDSREIEAALARDFPAVTFLPRPTDLLGGDVPMNEIILHDLTVVEGDFFLQTHATNPFLRAESVDAAVAAFEAAYPERDSLFSVTRLQRRLWSEAGEPVNHDPDRLIPTQNLPPLFEENSCLYIFAREVMESRRNRIGERPLEPHEVRPVDRKGARPQAVLRQGARGIHRRRRTHQHLFRIAAAQRARPAERPFVDHGDAPAGGAAPRRSRASRRSGADDDEVECTGHRQRTLWRMFPRVNAPHCDPVHSCAPGRVSVCQRP